MGNDKVTVTDRRVLAAQELDFVIETVELYDVHEGNRAEIVRQLKSVRSYLDEEPSS